MRAALVIKQHQDLQFLLYHRAMAALPIDVDRAGRTPLAGQIYQAIRRAIQTGRLASGARLPSWRDLAAQLGVSRGTVRVAYQRLIDEQFAIGFGGKLAFDFSEDFADLVLNRVRTLGFLLEALRRGLCLTLSCMRSSRGGVRDGK